MVSSRAVAVTVAVAIGLLWATPLRALWARDGGPWWLPFALWAPLIAILARSMRDRGSP
jgi:hypothetical protein